MANSDAQQDLQKALSLHQGGRLDQAADLYRRIVRRNPKNYYALHYLGIVEANLGNYQEAKALMDRSLSIQPPRAEFAENYATILFQMGDYKSALEISKGGLQFSHANVPLLYVSAISLFRLEQLEESVTQFDKLLLLAPNHIAAINERGSVLAEMKKYDAALASFEKALTFQPQYAEAHLNKGNVLGALKRYDDALAAYDKALALKPNLADAWAGRGNVLRELKRYYEALGVYDKALSLKADLAGAWLGRGNVFNELRRYDDALAAYDRALALNRKLAGAWLGRGNVFFDLRRHDEAFAAYDKALALKPDLGEAWLGRGNVVFHLKRYDEAFAAYDKALVLKPDLAEAWLGRGNVFSELKRFDDAFAAYDRAVALKPDLNEAASLRLHAKLRMCDWTNLETEVAQLLATIREQKSSSVPFTILAIPSSAADQLQCARCHVQDQPAFSPLWQGEVYSHDRIRVAYLSADFREHAVAYLTAGLFEHHDKSRFETTALSIAPARDSPTRDRIKRAFECFIDVRNQSDQDIAAFIRRNEIDIAVDLMGFTADNRHNVFARRPAPIQVNYLGYPGTMGAGYIDYILADPTIIPEDQRAFYTERVVWLPETYQINDNRRRISERTPTRGECGLPDTVFVFCCFNNTYKITPEIFDSWMRLLRATENSVLWLYEGDSAAAANLRREAEKRGVSSQRLIFASKMSPADHLARHRQADLFLDTLPYNAHTTASDALWAGLPVLTCLGTTFAGRVAGSLLRAVGLDELVTHSLEEYEALALKLARDPSCLASLRDRLARNRNTFPLFDTERVTRQIESAYTMMWERYQRGEVPKSV